MEKVFPIICFKLLSSIAAHSWAIVSYHIRTAKYQECGKNPHVILLIRIVKSNAEACITDQDSNAADPVQSKKSLLTRASDKQVRQQGDTKQTVEYKQTVLKGL